MAHITKVKPEDAGDWGKSEYIVAPSAAAKAAALPEPANVMIVWIETMHLRPAPWNPPARTTKRAVGDLIKRIEEEGFEPFRPILVSRDGYIGDGHRRWTAAQYLGLAKVPAIFTDKSVEDLWAGNKGSRPVRGSEWMAVSVLGGVKGLPPRTEDQVAQLVTVLGNEGVRYLIERGQSPDIWRTVWKIGAYCDKTDTPFLRKATYWLVKHKMVHRVNRATSPKAEALVDPRMLRQAIESDTPLKQNWAL